MPRQSNFFSILSPEHYWVSSTDHQIESQSIKKQFYICIQEFSTTFYRTGVFVCWSSPFSAVRNTPTISFSSALFLSCSLRPSHLLCIVCFSTIITTVNCTAVTSKTLHGIILNAQHSLLVSGHHSSF